MRGLVWLPPDWRQLSALRSLAVLCCREADWGRAGGAPASLPLLTRLELYSGALPKEQDFPRALCGLSNLRCLRVEGRTWSDGGRRDGLRLRLPGTFTRLSALERLETRHLPLSEAAEKLVRKKMPGVQVSQRGWF